MLCVAVIGRTYELTNEVSICTIKLLFTAQPQQHVQPNSLLCCNEPGSQSISSSYIPFHHPAPPGQKARLPPVSTLRNSGGAYLGIMAPFSLIKTVDFLLLSYYLTKYLILRELIS